MRKANIIVKWKINQWWQKLLVYGWSYWLTTQNKSAFTRNSLSMARLFWHLASPSRSFALPIN
jgi:hypothetical protein